MIEGVIITPLLQIEDERGKVMHMLRNDMLNFSSFGEIYFSTVRPGAVKGWHLHQKMVLNYAVPHGAIKFVMFDNRDESRTRGVVQEVRLGSENYCLITVPPMVWSGFQGVSAYNALVANCASIPHDPSEIERRHLSDPMIPYVWSNAGE